MALANSPPATADTSNEQRSTRTTGTKRWRNVVALWAIAVGAQALVLFLLAQREYQEFRTFKLEVVAMRLAEGELVSAKRYLTEPDYFWYPTGALIAFAVVGIAVLLLAWAGRRSLAVALPLALAAWSVGPTDDFGPVSAVPLGGRDAEYLWTALVPNTTDGPPTWPLLLGVAVQTGLLLMPLIAVPARRALVPLGTAVRWTVLPALAVAVVSLAAIESPSTASVYTDPLAAFALMLLSGAIVTGAGGTWQRRVAAVTVAALIASILSPIDLYDLRANVVVGLMAAAMSAFGLLGMYALSALHRRHHQGQTGVGDVLAPAAS